MTAFIQTRLEPGGDATLPAPEARIDVKLDTENRTGTVRGIVTDLSDRPISEAMVQLAKNRFEPVAGCLTQPDGTFEFRNVPAKTQYWLYAGRKGFKVFDSPPFFLLESQEIRRHIRLCPDDGNLPPCLAGRVIDVDGRPAALSAVLVFRLAGDTLEYHSFNFCDESGRFMAANLKPGPYLLRIIAEGYPPVNQNLRISYRDRLVKLEFVLSEPHARR
ncbi:MAG TPA: carboxypeptidase-like regulatory domain-containing protein [Thermoclostridium caenicola]|uniref:Carboxypeptidase regulatory-like domain-containing protein n=1 Tax=Thermoclostridium caenicola TaxID=659425 RepID=A0A1M6J8N8_9FIRM|nr:carboxypeptidase-like regulatory domain-containing protein [Thermoclostridium caenicola]SHJ42992.1 Carboxypeptidase regulatory-like domain-containing protein [Thermoclostridium caenicola]HOK44149.1 carboxypeptidase-like regulatory domain-containing protein [Thermoclostridium caenicola]HOL85080.1 carboxypeptidase-like regulatory domain-containing protein [Thermoclostridium caenicola]HOP72278.1 carboxypeptidase-like regulatory domain-containing protein [Thermoclostridium caenicola]HPO77207.1 